MLLRLQRYLLFFTAFTALFVAASESPESYDVGKVLDPRSKHGKLHLQIYKTEPDFLAVSFDIIRRPSDSSQLAPGLLFVTIHGESGQASKGAQIYDMEGNLVWHSGVHAAQDLNVCDFLGHEGRHLSLHIAGYKSYVLDQKYQQVSRKYSSVNGHEFNLLPGGRSFLKVRPSRTTVDLSPYVKFKNGVVNDNCIDEINVKTGKLIFRWCYLDWLPIWDTTIFIQEDSARARSVNASMRSEKAGHGTKEQPWDFIHANAIDKFDGDYLFSCRHLDQIIKVAGPDNPHGVKPGTVLWRLGGRRSDFKQDFTFSRQHHVRYLSVTANETVISFFNNAWEGELKPSSKVSDGKIVKINNITMRAELVASYPHPDGSLSEGRGSTQVLPNGNVLVGYGRFPDLAEYSHNGTVLYHARITSYKPDRSLNLDIAGMDWSYRVRKHSNWVGDPQNPPKLLVYSLQCKTTAESPLIAYVSWNGATEVLWWRFFVSARRGKHGLWVDVGTFPKDGFETQLHLSSLLEAKLLRFTPFVWVQGLDISGKVLGEVYARTWVPKKGVQSSCDASGCTLPTQPFWYRWDDARSCPHGRDIPPLVAFGLFVCLIEISAYLWRKTSTFQSLRGLRFNLVIEKSELSDHHDPLLQSDKAPEESE